MLEIEKCCEGVLTPPTRENLENLFRSFDIPSIETQSVAIVGTIRRNLGIHISYHFNDFPSKMADLGLKWKFLKFSVALQLHHIDLIDKNGTKTSNFYILDMSIYWNLTADRKLEWISADKTCFRMHNRNAMRYELSDHYAEGSERSNSWISVSLLSFRTSYMHIIL